MPWDEAAERAAAERAAAVRTAVGHPEEHWVALIERIQAHAIKAFSEVANDWLRIVWCLDQYRIAQAPPDHMGNLEQEWNKRLEAAYRGKGNWFATLLALLLDNRTGRLGSGRVAESRAFRKFIRSTSRGPTVRSIHWCAPRARFRALLDTATPGRVMHATISPIAVRSSSLLRRT